MKMKKKMKKNIWIITAICTVLSVGCAGNKDGVSEDTVAVSESEERRQAESPTGKDIVSFQTDTLAGDAVDESLFADANITMVNVWATYSEPCLEELSYFGELADEYADRDFQIVGIISDVQQGDDVETAKALVKETGADYPHLLMNQEIYSTYFSGVTEALTTFFVDSEGRQVGERYIGARSKEEWKEIIESNLQ